MASNGPKGKKSPNNRAPVVRADDVPDAGSAASAAEAAGESPLAWSADGKVTAAKGVKAKERAAGARAEAAARTAEPEPPAPLPPPAPTGRWLRARRGLPRIVGILLGIGFLGDAFAAQHYLAEALLLRRAVQAGERTFENLNPGGTLPTVWVLAGLAIAFAAAGAVTAVLILRGRPVGMAMLVAGGAAVLPARLLTCLVSYVRYQDYSDAVPSKPDLAYRSAIIGQVFGSAVGAAALVAAILGLLGGWVWRWYRPSVVAEPLEPPSPRAVLVARGTALAATLVGLLVSVGWVRPVGNGAKLPSEWSIIAVVSGLIAVATLLAMLATVAVRPDRPLVRRLALTFVVVVAAFSWLVTLWEWFYADVAFGPESVSGVAGPWLVAVASGAISSGLLTATAIALAKRPIRTAATAS